MLERSMTYQLHIPECIDRPRHPLHFPPVSRPLRIAIEGPLSCVTKLVPHVDWELTPFDLPHLQAAAEPLARLAFLKIYGRDVNASIDGDMTIRDEYLGWVTENPLK